MNPKKFQTKTNQINNQNRSSFVNNFKKTSTQQSSSRPYQLLVKIGIKWYKQKLENLPQNSDSSGLNHEQITLLRNEAIQLLKTDYYHYDQQKSSRSNGDDFEWIKNVLVNGTVHDKLAAYTVLIQDSSVHNLRSLESLIRFINPKGKRECIMAIDTVKDLFIGDLLIPNKKLKTFEQNLNLVSSKFLFLPENDSNNNPHQQQENVLIRKKFLLLSYVEDQIRSCYKKFLEQLISCSHDQLDQLKSKSINTLFDLFNSNPEQEKFLLENLINKLGDPSSKIASNTARLLTKILENHPKMKMIIVKDVERLIFRPNITKRTEYYSLCFLSQIIFDKHNDQSLANYLIQIYFTLFKKLIKIGEINNKIMTVLLTGITRTFPYSKLSKELIEENLNTFYKLIHYVNLNTSIQIYLLIYQMITYYDAESTTKLLSDRFYQSLYRFIWNIKLDQCSKLNLLLNLIYRSMKQDPISKRVRSFVKRLLQISFYSSASMAASILILISELTKSKTGFRLDLILPDDDDIDDNNNDGKLIDSNLKNPQENQSISGWVYTNNNFDDNNRDSAGNNNNHNNGKDYNFNARNPLYTNAEYEPLWELIRLQQHYHPTVRLFARKLLEQKPISDDYDGDPLDDFSLKNFLRRFSFKNPKKSIDDDNDNNANQMNDQKPSTTKVFRRKSSKYSKSIDDLKEMVKKSESEIPIDEMYIYKFLKQRKQFGKSNSDDNPDGNDDDDDESDIESVNSLEFNELLDNFECGNNNFDDSIIMEDKDYAKDFNKKKKKKNSIDDDDEADFDDELDEDDLDLDDDLDDEDLDDFDDDDDDDMDDDNDDGNNLDDDDNDDYDDDFDIDEPDIVRKQLKLPKNMAPFKGKRGFSKITNDIFATAEKFDYLLDQNDDINDDDLDSDDNQDDDDDEFGRSKSRNNSSSSSRFGKKRKRPSNSRQKSTGNGKQRKNPRQKPKPKHPQRNKKNKRK